MWRVNLPHELLSEYSTLEFILQQCSRRSFLWNGILQALSSFRKNLISTVRDGTSTLFWLDNWVDGCAPADIWPYLFQMSQCKEGTIKDLANWSSFVMLGDFPISRNLIDQISLHSSLEGEGGHKWWRLTTNGLFSVKSFYNFLNDGSLRCHWSPIILKGRCPKKINLSNW